VGRPDAIYHIVFHEFANMMDVMHDGIIGRIGIRMEAS
jgi:hypothetical protein